MNRSWTAALNAAPRRAVHMVCSRDMAVSASLTNSESCSSELTLLAVCSDGAQFMSSESVGLGKLLVTCSHAMPAEAAAAKRLALLNGN
jgi:hypothetical protein